MIVYLIDLSLPGTGPFLNIHVAPHIWEERTCIPGKPLDTGYTVYYETCYVVVC